MRRVGRLIGINPRAVARLVGSAVMGLVNDITVVHLGIIQFQCPEGR